VTHAIVDFSWYIPACMSLTLVLAGCALRLSHFRRDGGDVAVRRCPQAVWAGFAVALLLLTGWQCSVLLPSALAAPHWDRFVALLEAADHYNPQPLQGAAAELGKVDGAHPDTLSGMMHHLQAVVDRNPTDARAHLRLAGVAIQTFELRQQQADNAMPLNQVRDAALASEFPGREAMLQWLELAIGDNLANLHVALHHTLLGLQLCPMQGEGYAYLVEVGFLGGMKQTDYEAFVAQALKVRPHDASVLYLAGREAWLKGDVARGVEMTRAAFHRSLAYRTKVIRNYAAILPVDDFVKLFQPGLPELATLYVFYEKQRMPQQQRLAGAIYADHLMNAARQEEGDSAADLWWQASQICRQIAQPQPALQCGEAALRYAPNRLEIRRHLTDCLLDVEQFADAEKHLRWCLNRRPNDATLLKNLELATKGRLRRAAGERAATSR
jgi:tetratricopeptide (TPR) repeat protein